MRELAKSMVRLSWAMSVFGIEQARELLRDEDEEPPSDVDHGPARSRDTTVATAAPPTAAAPSEEESSGRRASRRVASSLDEISEEAHRRLGRRARSLYESGNDLQSEMIDLFFDAFDRDQWKPGRVLDRAADFAEKSADRLRDWASDEKERAAEDA